MQQKADGSSSYLRREKKEMKEGKINVRNWSSGTWTAPRPNTTQTVINDPITHQQISLHRAFSCRCGKFTRPTANSNETEKIHPLIGCNETKSNEINASAEGLKHTTRFFGDAAFPPPAAWAPQRFWPRAISSLPGQKSWCTRSWLKNENWERQQGDGRIQESPKELRSLQHSELPPLRLPCRGVQTVSIRQPRVFVLLEQDEKRKNSRWGFLQPDESSVLCFCLKTPFSVTFYELNIFLSGKKWTQSYTAVSLD